MKGRKKNPRVRDGGGELRATRTNKRTTNIFREKPGTRGGKVSTKRQFDSHVASGKRRTCWLTRRVAHGLARAARSCSSLAIGRKSATVPGRCLPRSICGGDRSGFLVIFKTSRTKREDIWRRRRIYLP